MVARDPEVDQLARETVRLVARAELVYENLVGLQKQIYEFLERAQDLADRTERTLRKEDR